LYYPANIWQPCGTTIPAGYIPCRRFIGKGWERVAIEFEFKSSDFKQHKHDPKDCDMIICWENDWNDCPLEVLEYNANIWAKMESHKRLEMALATGRATGYFSDGEQFGTPKEIMDGEDDND
jgi:hypothetical protein